MFIILQMQGIALNAVIDDPLAGCLPLMQWEGNAINMMRALLLRLRIFYSEGVATSLGEQIIKESGAIAIDKWEYCINEVQYERRRCLPEYDERFETVVLNNWTKNLLKRLPEDLVLPFFVKVRANREVRKR